MLVLMLCLQVALSMIQAFYKGGDRSVTLPQPYPLPYPLRDSRVFKDVQFLPLNGRFIYKATLVSGERKHQLDHQSLKQLMPCNGYHIALTWLQLRKSLLFLTALWPLYCLLCRLVTQTMQTRPSLGRWLTRQRWTMQVGRDMEITVRRAAAGQRTWPPECTARA
jgi:hypothetical protein